MLEGVEAEVVNGDKYGHKLQTNDQQASESL